MITVEEKRNTIRLLRRAAELTQSDVAERAGFSRALLSHYESGRVDLGADDLLRVENVINKALEKKPGRLVPMRSLLANTPEFLQEKKQSMLMNRVEELEKKLAAYEEKIEKLEASKKKIEKLEATISTLVATLAEHIGTSEAEADA